MTIASSLQQFIHSEKIAIHYCGQKINYPQLIERISTTKRKLLSYLPMPEHKVVAFLIHNKLEFLTLFLAIAELGAIALPLDPKWSGRDLDAIMDDARPDLLITDDRERFSHGFVPLETFLAAEPSFLPLPNVSSDTLFYLGYTSGTTGKPKGFVRTHASWLNSFQCTNAFFQLNSADRILSPGPLVHSHFLYAAVHALSIGATLYLPEKFDAGDVLSLMEKERISAVYIVPTMFQAMLKRYEEKKARPNVHLRTILSSGAKWHPASRKKAKLLFPNAKIFEFYGASELSFVTYLDEKGFEYDLQSAGRPFPNVQVSIRHESGKEAHPGEIGELYVKSGMIFAGYWNDDELTKKVRKGEWATVGDLAVMDKNGYIRLVGRKSNMILSGGLNVYPEEIEHVLEKHPAIEEAAVIGVEDDYWGEKAVAFLRLKEGQTLTKEELKTYCRKYMATYKCPKMFFSVKAFPYTSSGKIARKQLKSLLGKGEVIS